MTKVLSSMQILEFEEHDDVDIAEESSKEHMMQEIISSLSTPLFESTYKLFMPEVRKLDFATQQQFCSSILERVGQVYSFSPIDVSLESKDDIEDVYKLVEFLEFDNLDFFAKLFRKLRANPLLVDVREFLQEKKTEVDSFISTFRSGSRLIDQFLMSYQWENMLHFLSERAFRQKVEIAVTLEGGEI